MADKRTEQSSEVDPVSDFDAYCNLGFVLASGVLCWGKALFEDAALLSRRREHGSILRATFPGEQFPFWKKQVIPEKPRLEAEALLQALRQLMEKQAHRVQRSGHLQQDFLPLLKRLYRQELLKPAPEEEVRSPWRTTGQADAASGKLALQRWKQANRDEGADVSDALTMRSALQSAEPSSRLDQAQLGYLMCEIQKKLISFLGSLRNSRLTLGELRTLYDAAGAILDGASCYCGPTRPRRGDALSCYLSPAQMRQLRRACAKDGEVRPFLADLSRWLANIRKRLPKDPSAPQEGMKRRRVGKIFLDMAKEAEAAGFHKAATGLRARDRLEWGRVLAEEERKLMTKDAADWVIGVFRPHFLARIPDLQTEAERVLKDGSDAAARNFAQTFLGWAVFCWPQGAFASFAPPPAQPD